METRRFRLLAESLRSVAGALLPQLLLFNLFQSGLPMIAEAAPLEQWRADRNALQHGLNAARSDLPDEWQELDDKHLQEVLGSLYKTGDLAYYDGEYEKAIADCQLYAFGLPVLGIEAGVAMALNDPLQTQSSRGSANRRGHLQAG